jgi:cytochrome c
MPSLTCPGKQSMIRVLALLACAALAACQTRASPPRRQVSGGEPGPGRHAFLKYGCGGCHAVPGVRGAHGRVAAPLDAFGQRAFVAGVLSNTPDNLITWIMFPQQVNPKTAMPNLGVDEQDARDIAAFLYSLDGG